MLIFRFINFFKALFQNQDISKMPSMWFGGLTISTYFVFFNFFFVKDHRNITDKNIFFENISSSTLSLVEWLTYITVFFITGIFYLILLRKKSSINFLFQKSLNNLFYIYIICLFFISNFYFLGLISLFFTIIFVNKKNFFDFKFFNTYLFYLCIFLIGSKILWWGSFYELITIKDLSLHIDKYKIFILQNEFRYSFLIDKIISLNNLDLILKFFTLLFSLLILFLLFFDKDSSSSKKKYFYLLLLIPIFLFFIESFSTYEFNDDFKAGFTIHWQVLLAPLELISQGGYLLWDTPSQYGFLSVLLPYILPFKTHMQSFYILNGIFVFIFSLQLFLIIWNNRGLYWYTVSLLLTLSLVFYLNSGPSVSNASEVPMDGPYRYFWSTTLLWILFSFKKNKYSTQLLIILPTWLVGFLWSPESAIYVTAIIVPFFINLAFNNNITLNKKIILILLAPLLLIISILFISLYYKIFLGHLPDYYSFIDYLIGTLITMDANPKGHANASFILSGPIIIILLIFSYIISVYQMNTKNKYSYLIISSFFGLGAMTSYLISQSEEINIVGHLVYYFFGIFLIINHFNLKDNYIMILKPIILCVIIISFCNPRSGFHLYQTFKNQDYLFQKNVTSKNNEINLILNKVNPQNTPISITESNRYLIAYTIKDYYNENLGQSIALNNDAWIPFKISPGLYERLPNYRKFIYLSRWLDRKSLNSGWYITPINYEWAHKKYEDILFRVLKENNYEMEKMVTSDLYRAYLFSKN
jgi:hypothetical protein